MYIPDLTLKNGIKIPAFGFGTYKLNERDECIASVTEAIKNGYRLIDTAYFYDNEEFVGEAIERAISSGYAKREELFIVTKIWFDELGYDKAKCACERSLKALGLDHLDMMLIHWPADDHAHDDWNEQNLGAWKAMTEFCKEGRFRSIGVANFWPEHLEPLLETEIPPALDQIEFHPGYMQKEVLEYCQEKGIAVEAWSPLARGAIFDHPLMVKIAEDHGKSPAQIALRWVYQHGAIAIPKSSSPERMRENADIFGFELTVAEMKALDDMEECGFSGHTPKNMERTE